MANDTVTSDGGGLRAAAVRPVGAAAPFTTDRMVAVLLIAALLVLVVIRRGFSGALGD